MVNAKQAVMGEDTRDIEGGPRYMWVGKINCRVKKLTLVLAAILAMMANLDGCSKQDAHTEKNFVGKWKSSRVTEPVYLYENGEWEIKPDEGEILQYGVWQYTDNKILWSYKVDDQMGHDTNAVLSVTPREFQLRESDKSTTTFSRLD